MGSSGNRRMDFKKFTVLDDKCAMKIGTDAVMLGAWSEPQLKEVCNIADVGSGSGVIALMLAQRFPHSKILGIELDPLAAEQSRENFNASPFSDRLSCFEGSFQTWSDESINHRKYDLVVSNPPFFHNKPKSPFQARNLARHDDYLSINDLFIGSAKVLNEEGVFAVVWPVERESDLMVASDKAGFQIIRKCDILPTLKHDAVRFLAEFTIINKCERNVKVAKSQFILETGVGTGRNFTTQYNNLMAEFFLGL